MKKALIITTVSGFVPQFEMNNVRILQDLGYEIHYASNFHNIVYGEDNTRLNGSGIIKHQIDFRRNPFSLRNFIAFKKLRELASNNQFNLVHCHTPVGGFLGRAAFHSSECKIIYTAHGFHFYRGAGPLNWLLFYPVECMLASWTDELITINKEDYNRAKKFKLRNNGKVTLINGVGIDLSQIDDIPSKDRIIFNKEYRMPENAVLLVSVGELNKNKNHIMMLRALKILKDKYPIYYFICGKGNEKEKLIKKAIKYSLSNRVFLVGYYSNVIEILKIADIFVNTSKREGLPISALEAMACGRPIVATKIRGNQDLVVEGKGGFLVPFGDANKMAESIENIINSKDVKKYGIFNRKRSEAFSISAIEKKMREIYSR